MVKEAEREEQKPEGFGLIELETDDIFLLKVKQKVPAEVIYRLREDLERGLGKSRRILVLDDSVELYILREAQNVNDCINTGAEGEQAAAGEEHGAPERQASAAVRH